MTRKAARTRIVLADPQPIVLDALARLFLDQPDFVVAARSATSVETLAAVRKHRPHVLVIDPFLPDVTGLAVLHRLRRDHPTIRAVLFVTTLSDDETIEALRLDVRGMVLKEQPPRQLVQCVRRVRAGGHWMEKTTTRRALEALLRREMGMREFAGVLTPRELELAQMVALGLGTDVVAERLAISRGTVKVHLHHIYRKLNLSSRMELVLLAREKQLI